MHDIVYVYYMQLIQMLIFRPLPLLPPLLPPLSPSPPSLPSLPPLSPSPLSLPCSLPSLPPLSPSPALSPAPSPSLPSSLLQRCPGSGGIRERSQGTFRPQTTGCSSQCLEHQSQLVHTRTGQRQQSVIRQEWDNALHHHSYDLCSIGMFCIVQWHCVHED